MRGSLCDVRGLLADDAARLAYATSAGTAIPGVDYLETTGTLDFAAGEKKKSCSILLLDDFEVDGSKTFTVYGNNFFFRPGSRKILQ